MAEPSTFNARIAQALALLGLGVWFLAIPESGGKGECSSEGECTFLKPTMVLTLDYSTDMNLPHGQVTRWEATVAAVNSLLAFDNGFFQENLNVAVMRVGHDPDPQQPDTPIPGDTSGLRDGQALDVGWYDEDLLWFGCMGGVIADTLEQLPAPLDGASDGIGAWQAGAAARVGQLVQQAKADHPEDDDKTRTYLNVVFTGSPWTGATGSGQPAQDDPAPIFADLYQGSQIPTYVVRVGDGLPQDEADAWAAAGGTNAAHDVDDAMGLQTALFTLVQEIKDAVKIPQCMPQRPRITVVLDASSDMLNVDGAAGMMGETPWDHAAELLGLSHPLWDATVNWGELEDFTLTSLVVFGGDQPDPGEQRLVVPMGECNAGGHMFGWALNPEVSCQMPGCDDPWGGPDIEWTFADAEDTLFCWFDPGTTSHMPQCHGNGPACAGSGRFVHLGLQEALELQQAYHAANAQPNAGQPVDDATIYYNLLVVGGSYQGWSTDAEVQQALEQNLAAGIVTFVLAVGPAADDPDPQLQDELAAMADWGSGGQFPPFTPNTISALQDYLVDVISNTPFDPCCGFPSCNSSDWGEGCAEGEPDPVPPPPDTTGTTTDGGGTGDTGTTGTTGTETTDTTGVDPADDSSTWADSHDTGDDASSADSTLGRGCACDAGGSSPPPTWAWAVVVLGVWRRRG